MCNSFRGHRKNHDRVDHHEQPSRHEPEPDAVGNDIVLRTILATLKNQNERLLYMSTEVDAITPKIDTLVDLVHQLILKVGTPVAISPEDSAALSSDGGKLDAAIAAANAVLNPAPVPAAA